VLNQLKALFAPAATARTDHDLRTAVAALLVEAAWSEKGFEPAEQTKIATLLQHRFDISQRDAEDLVHHGNAVGHNQDLFPFTRRVIQGMDEDERVHMIEMLWEVAYADGKLDPDEERVIGKIANLLFISASERNGAKRRAKEKAGLE
jgi:uncharacterized tellurite resistance protein B-like protein